MSKYQMWASVDDEVKDFVDMVRRIPSENRSRSAMAAKFILMGIEQYRKENPEKVANLTPSK